jgi:hypothetical protein
MTHFWVVQKWCPEARFSCPGDLPLRNGQRVSVLHVQTPVRSVVPVILVNHDAGHWYYISSRSAVLREGGFASDFSFPINMLVGIAGVLLIGVVLAFVMASLNGFFVPLLVACGVAIGAVALVHAIRRAHRVAVSRRIPEEPTGWRSPPPHLTLLPLESVSHEKVTEVAVRVVVPSRAWRLRLW